MRKIFLSLASFVGISTSFMIMMDVVDRPTTDGAFRDTILASLMLTAGIVIIFWSRYKSSEDDDALRTTIPRDIDKQLREWEIKKLPEK